MEGVDEEEEEMVGDVTRSYTNSSYLPITHTKIEESQPPPPVHQLPLILPDPRVED